MFCHLFACSYVPLWILNVAVVYTGTVSQSVNWLGMQNNYANKYTVYDSKLTLYMVSIIKSY